MKAKTCILLLIAFFVSLALIRVCHAEEGAVAARIAKMEKIADHALVPPVVNTSPLPRYGYDRLDYGMTIGIERALRGRLWACWVAGGDSPKAFFVLATSDDDGETIIPDPKFKPLPVTGAALE